MRLEQEDIDIIVNRVLSALRSNVRTISQLTSVTMPSGSDEIELSGGKKISISSLMSRMTTTSPWHMGEGESSAYQWTSKSIGDYSVAENQSTAKGICSHSEGYSTAIGTGSHAEGAATIAEGDTSHAEGYGTQAKCRGEHASGMFNLSTCDDGDPSEWDNTNKGRTLFSVGNGSGENARHNALEIKPDGEILISDFSSGAPPEKKPMISLSERVNFQPMTEIDILQIYIKVYKERYGSLD